MKSVVIGLVCAGLLGASLAMAQEKISLPGAAAAPNEKEQLKTQAKELEKKIGEIRKQIESSEEIVALKKKADDATKATRDAVKAKLDADAKYVDAAQKIKEAQAQQKAIEAEVQAAPEIKNLQQAEKDARSAVSSTSQAKLAADPNAGALMKEQEALTAKIREASQPKTEAPAKNAPAK